MRIKAIRRYELRRAGSVFCLSFSFPAATDNNPTACFFHSGRSIFGAVFRLNATLCNKFQRDAGIWNTIGTIVCFEREIPEIYTAMIPRSLYLIIPIIRHDGYSVSIHVHWIQEIYFTIIFLLFYSIKILIIRHAGHSVSIHVRCIQKIHPIIFLLFTIIFSLSYLIIIPIIQHADYSISIYVR